MKIFKRKSALVFGMMALLAVALPAAHVAADMMIMPVRVFFKDGERMKSLTVLNKGAEQAVFRLSMQHKKQLPDGGYLNLGEPLMPGVDPSTWLVYSPRQVSLEPQGKQGIRLSLRRPADLPDGEYRVHLALDRTARDVISRDASPKDKVDTRMSIAVGFAIPVVIRKGRNDAVATIKGFEVIAPNLKEKDQRARLMVDINRTGKFGTVGEVNVFWTPPGGGDEVMVGQQKGVIIYPEVSDRKIRVFLNQMVQGGKLRVVYSGLEVDRGTTFDEKTFSL